MRQVHRSQVVSYILIKKLLKSFSFVACPVEPALYQFHCDDKIIIVNTSTDDFLCAYSHNSTYTSLLAHPQGYSDVTTKQAAEFEYLNCVLSKRSTVYPLIRASTPRRPLLISSFLPQLQIVWRKNTCHLVLIVNSRLIFMRTFQPPRNNLCSSRNNTVGHMLKSLANWYMHLSRHNPTLASYVHNKLDIFKLQVQPLLQDLITVFTTSPHIFIILLSTPAMWLMAIILCAMTLTPPSLKKLMSQTVCWLLLTVIMH